MRSAQIIAIGLDDAADTAELLFPGRQLAVDAADDIEEAAELAGVVGADIVLASAASLGDDPFPRLERLAAALGEGAPSVIAFYPGAFQITRAYLRSQAAGEWVTVSPGGERLAPFLAALLEKGDAFVHFELPAIAGLRNRLIDVGFNSLVKIDAGDVSVQTETHVLGKKTVIRSTAFLSGRIALSRRFVVGFIANPLEEARRLADDIHRETCARMAGGAPAAG